jgi:HD-GYP domain-containing protein (c-di-GMP phosphodiesterase class II)
MLGTVEIAALGVVVVVVLVVVVTVAAAHRRSQLLPLELDLTKMETIEQASTQVLSAIGAWTPVRAAFAYWRTADGTRYRLRGTLEPRRASGVGPAYSGIAAEANERVPVVLRAEEVPEEITVSGPRKERWLWIPFPQARFAVHLLLPRGVALTTAQRKRIARSAQSHTPLLFAVGQWLSAHESAQRLRRMAASRTALDTGTQLDGAIELLLRIGGRIVGASLQFALVDGSDGHTQISDSEDGLAWAKRTVSGGVLADLLVIDPDPDLVPLGAHAAKGLVACARVPILADDQALGCFYLLVESVSSLSPFEIAALRALGQRAAQVIGGQRHMREAARHYVATLQALVQAMDALAPTSIGHSDRCAGYARAIAKEMGLEQRQIEDIVLAAKLHDVGMIAVDARLVLKPDQFTVDEFELMKGHAELGGQLLQSLPQGPAISQMVASHHERWDGGGYPLGLAGGDIPLGARIIAAAEYFDAKTSGRSYRSPVPYQIAVEDLRRASGTGLDPRVVTAFLNALQAQRATAAPSLPSAPCWRLKAMPEHICGDCPNRAAHPTRCWESPRNLCTRHGDKCETCIVYTEAASRDLVHQG